MYRAVFNAVCFDTSVILTGEPQGLPNHVRYPGVPLSFALYLDRFLLICIEVTNPPESKRAKYSYFFKHANGYTQSNTNLFILSRTDDYIIFK